MTPYETARDTYRLRNAGESQHYARDGGRQSSRGYRYRRASGWAARAYSAAASGGYGNAEYSYSASSSGDGYGDGDYETTVSGETRCVVERRVVRRQGWYRTIRVQVCD